MKNQRFGQISLSFCVVLSLLISSLSICACAHHQENNLTGLSCHANSEMSGEMPMHAESDGQNAVQNAISESANCHCIQPAPKTFSKSELLKVEKQAAEIVSVIDFTVEKLLQISTANPANFSNVCYFSDSSYNIKSPRAPPSL